MGSSPSSGSCYNYWVGRNYSYSLQAYRDNQSRIAKIAWKRRYVDFQHKREIRTCARPQCVNKFAVSACNPKRFCSRSCSAQANNISRGARSEKTKLAISETLKGRPNPFKGSIKVPRIEIICSSRTCGKKFLAEPWRTRKYCSNLCSMRIVGGKPTSPRASRGKAGIRRDISPSIYFYSRWEANIARLYTYLEIDWQYAPKTFDIGDQMSHTYVGV